MEPKDQLDIELASEKKPEHKQPVRHSHHPARQKTDLLNVLVIGTLVTGTALWFLFGTRPTESEIENRNLAKFPSFSWSDYISGKYTADIATTLYPSGNGSRIRLHPCGGIWGYRWRMT